MQHTKAPPTDSLVNKDESKTDQITSASSNDRALGNATAAHKNGNGKFSAKTIDAVRETTERFFRDDLKKSEAEARRRAKRLTENWAKDLELTR